MAINLTGTTYVQDFDTLANSGTNNALLPEGWAIAESGGGARDNEQYAADTGGSTTGDTYSYGSAGSTERAFGGLQSGSLIPTIGASFTNSTGATITAFNLAYMGEQWRLGTAGRPDRLDFQYSLDATSLNSGAWTDVDTLDFTAPATTGTVGLRDGNAAANRTAVSGAIDGLAVAPGGTVWIRWSDVNAIGSDDGLAVDDFSITPVTSGNPVRPVVTIAATDADAAEGTPANPGAFTVTRSGDTTAALTLTYTINGTATNSTDYEALSGTVEIPAGQNTATIGVTPLTDNLVEGNETVVLTLQGGADFDLGTASATVVIGDSLVLVPIYEIQGGAHTSPRSGQEVITSGIVTAIDTTGGRGFYLQDAVGDGNIATSDAIFVFTNSAPTVRVGDAVQVKGIVSEFTPGGVSSRNLSTTQIGGNPTITTLSTGNPLPRAVILGEGGRVPPTENIDDDAFGSFDPVTDGIDFFESLEGMRVTAQDLLVVNGTNGFGEIFGVVDDGAGATGLSDRGTLNLSPDDFNPERIQLQFDNGVTPFAFPQVNVGNALGDVTGVLGYGFGNYEIVVTDDFTSQIVSGSLQPEVSILTKGSDQLTVASYNVLNLDPNDDPSETEADTDIADGRFDAIAQQIVNNLSTPDIIALQEVQDNSGGTDNGVTAADVTLQTLVDAIAAAGGPTYTPIDNTFIGDNTSGGQPGGNIRTAYLYDPSRVNLVERSVATISDEAFQNARLPLIASFEFNGETVTLVNNHFSSKGGSAPILGTAQPFEARQEDPTVNGSLDERRAQSLAVQGYVNGLLGSDPSANVVVLGDLNEFEFVSPVRDLVTNSGLTNLTETLPEDERYTFIFQGNSQAIDHILVSDSLAAGAEYDAVHVNTEFAESLQASDHDPVLARFTIEAPNVITGTSQRDVLVGTDRNDIILASGGPDQVTTGGGRDQIVYTSTSQTGATITDFQVGADKLVFTGLLASINYSGTDPITDGVLQFDSRGNSGKTVLSIDPDGFSGNAKARNFLTVEGVEAAALSNADNFVF